MRTGYVLLTVLGCMIHTGCTAIRQESAPSTKPDLRRELSGDVVIGVVTYWGQEDELDILPLAIPNLVEYVNSHTQIRCRMEKTRLDAPRLFECSILYITGQEANLELTSTEIGRLGDYLRGGGFLFAEDVSSTASSSQSGAGLRGSPFDQRMKQILQEALGPEVKFLRIPNHHSLYHSFYDFWDGPPLGGIRGGNVDYLEGIQLQGRLTVIFSDLNISWYWAGQEVQGAERGLQFGVNLLAFAMREAWEAPRRPIGRRRDRSEE